MIGPHVWPTGVAPDSVLELILWDVQPNADAQVADHQQNQQHVQHQLVEEVLLRGQAAQQREDAVQQREAAAQQRELDVGGREQRAHQREEHLQRREQEMQQREQIGQLRREEIDHRDGEERGRESQDAICADLERIREYERLLSFLACKTRLGNYCI